MSRFQKRLAALAMLVFLSIALVIGLTKPEPAQDLVITTSTPGGTYIVIGEQLARILEEYPGKSIGSVTAIPSDGTPHNIERLVKGEADIALVVGPILAEHADRKDIGVLMSLYDDVWQVVVRKSASIEGLRDLTGKSVYVGADRSGTIWGATRILRTAGITESDYKRVKGPSYRDAALSLQEGEADAAFFVAATPVKAVADALSSGCCILLDLQDDLELIRKGVPSFKLRQIPSHIYENQPDPVQTLGARALLVARKDLRDDVALDILDSLFDNISELAVAHIRVQDIRLEKTFTGLPEGVQLHRAAQMFRDKESEKLRIATGVINGSYHDLGKRIQLVLAKKGISARVIHTDGSVENLRHLNSNVNTIAITQYDTALAAIWSAHLYNDSELAKILDIPSVKGLRRIVALREEIVHVVIRRDRIPAEAQENPTITALENARVSLGPAGSGTQVIAKALLHYHGVSPRERLYLSVPDMVARIGSGEIDAGFFVSYFPSEALKTVLHDGRNRLLSVDTRKIGNLIGAALSAARIESGTFGAQGRDEPPIITLKTRAVLVAREDLASDIVETITEAIFEGEAFLGIEGGATAMAEDMKSLPLHSGARASYVRHGFIPPEGWKPTLPEVVAVAWRAMAILVILVGGYQGILKLRRDRTSNEIGRRIISISLEPEEPDSVHKLLEIRDREILERVQRRWWRAGELDKSRWRYLHDLINDRIKQAKENLTAALAEDLRGLAHETGLNAADRRQRLESLEENVWAYFQKGELDTSHQAMLMEVIERSLG